MLFKICLVILCNEYDAEYAVQETFIKYLTKSPAFNDLEHEKAWLITVCIKEIGNTYTFKYNEQDKHKYRLAISYNSDGMIYDIIEMKSLQKLEKN